MSEFNSVDEKYDKKTFQVVSVIGEVQKNKFSTVRVAKVKFHGAEFIQLQVWKTENEKKFAAKGQNIIIKPEVAQKLGELLVKL